MRINNRRHNATVAKIRAMYGKRLSAEDYAQLASYDSVSEIAEYLKKNTHYGKTLASVDTVMIHRGLLESLLRRHNFETYFRITDFENIGRTEFYNHMIIEAEVDVILSCLRYINAKSDSQITELPIYINRYASFDLIEIAKIRSFDELLVFLKKTPYYDVLKDERADANGRVDFSVCEIRLRTYLIGRIEKAVSGYGRKEADSINSMILTDVDLINVINAYRMTAFFGENEEEIEKNMLPFSGRLSAAKQREIYSAPDEAEFIRRFSKTYYGRLVEEMGCNMDDLERNANLLRLKYAKLALKTSSSAAVSVYSFMYLRGIELRNIISIIEGVRYGVPSKEIEELLVI